MTSKYKRNVKMSKNTKVMRDICGQVFEFYLINFKQYLLFLFEKE